MIYIIEMVFKNFFNDNLNFLDRKLVILGILIWLCGLMVKKILIESFIVFVLKWVFVIWVWCKYVYVILLIIVIDIILVFVIFSINW